MELFNTCLQSLPPPPPAQDVDMDDMSCAVASAVPFTAVVPSLDIQMSNPAQEPRETMKTLVLANGTHLEFTRLDVADPPKHCFAHDIPKLARTWDDSRSDFSPSECSLKIKGHPIALKHLPAVYSYSGEDRWKAGKKFWDTWKVAVLSLPSLQILMFSHLVDCRVLQWNHARDVLG